MPAATITPELKEDLQLLKLRSAMDPKRHCKKSNAKSKTLPKYFQACLSLLFFYRTAFILLILKRKYVVVLTLAGELLSDPNFGQYRKRKVREIEDQNHPAGNDKWKIRG